MNTVKVWYFILGVAAYFAYIHFVKKVPASSATPGS